MSKSKKKKKLKKRKGGFQQADKILDTNLKIHIGNRDGIKSEHVIYYAPTGESSWKKTLRNLKHMYDPSLSGALPPVNGDGFEESKPVMRTRDDVIKIFELYKNKLIELEKKEKEKKREKHIAEDVAGSSSGSLGNAGRSVADDYESELQKLKKEKKQIEGDMAALIERVKGEKEENMKTISELRK